MGLDLRLLIPTGDGARWSYSGFNRFRERLAEDAGLGNLRSYTGYGGTRAWPSDDPLVALLDHSDCEGELWGWATEGLADRLRAIVLRWPEDAYDRQQGLRLADMLEAAARGGGLVEFS